MNRARTSLRGAAARAGSWLNQAAYLPKWLALGVLIGAIAGLGAVCFFEALQLTTRLVIGHLLSYTAPSPYAEPAGIADLQFSYMWLVPLVVAAGGLISGILVFRLAPEAEGHGTDAAIDAVHNNPRKIRSRAVLVKLVASAVTIGTGGSGGREGPAAQISAGFGSLLCRLFDLDVEDGRIAVSVGIGSGIGAIFGAPLGGAVTAADITYRDDFEPRCLVPGFVASATSYLIFGSVEGFHPLFGVADPSYAYGSPAELLWFVIIGLACGLLGLAYSTTFYGVIAINRRAPGSPMLKPAVGGLLTGLLVLLIPEVLGTGYGWIQDALSRQQLLTIPLWIVIVLPLAKIVATSLSIGTGGSGGVFGPGMIVGAFAGAAIWRLSNLVGFGATHSPAPYVIVAMMACFGAISRAPLAMMLMVAEMTGTVTMLAPAMISVGLAYLIVRHWDATIYRHQLRDRDERASARLTEQLPLLDRIPVRAAMTPPMIVLDADESSVDATKLLNRVGLTGAPVVDGQGRFVGAFNVHDIGGPTAGSTADPTAASVQDTVTLEAAAAALPASTGYLPILDQDKRIVGALTLNDVARAYHAASAADDAHRARDTDRPSIHEIKVEVGDDLHGSAVSETARYGLLVLSVRRGRTHRKVKDDFVLQEHDVLTVLSDEAFAKMKALKGDDVPGREQPGLRQFRVPGR